MKTRTVLYADEGMVLTNGEICGKVIFLAEETSVDKYYEISDSEYEEKLTELEDEVMEHTEQYPDGRETAQV